MQTTGLTPGWPKQKSMGKAKKSKIIWFGIIVMLGAMFLVIVATPWMYNLHLWNQNASSSDKAHVKTEPSTVFFNDTIILRKNTVITNRRLEIPQQGNATQASHSGTPSIEDLGTFGDSAGFFNAIFSALALFAVIYTLWNQITNDDKEEERYLLTQFRDHCFTLMAMLSEIVNQLKITVGNNQDISFSYSTSLPGGIYGNNNPHPTPSPNPLTPVQPKLEITGRACFKFVYEEFPGGRNVKQWIANSVGSHRDAVMSEDNYRSLRKVMGDTFDHYFRTLYRILLFIKESDLSGVKAKKCSDIREHCADMLRAQLSTYEMALLYYNGLYPDFRNTSKALFEEFCLFDNLDPLILCLKSEIDYYTECKKEGRNGQEYKESVHYDFRAFHKIKGNTDDNPADSNESDSKHSVNKEKICRISKFSCLKSKSKQKKEDTINVNERFSDEEKKVYEYIKKNQGKSLTKAKIAEDCKLSKESAKRILDDLEDRYRVIKSEASRNGKKFQLT